MPPSPWGAIPTGWRSGDERRGGRRRRRPLDLNLPSGTLAVDVKLSLGKRKAAFSVMTQK